MENELLLGLILEMGMFFNRGMGMMQDNEFSYYLQQLHSSESENAYFSLLTGTVDADVPKLIGAFYSEPDLQARVALLEILCQHCVPETLTFLATILQNPVTQL